MIKLKAFFEFFIIILIFLLVYLKVNLNFNFIIFFFLKYDVLSVCDVICLLAGHDFSIRSNCSLFNQYLVLIVYDLSFQEADKNDSNIEQSIFILHLFAKDYFRYIPNPIFIRDMDYIYICSILDYICRYRGRNTL